MEKALGEMTDGMAAGERAAFVALARAQIGLVLSEAPLGNDGQVEEIALRAWLAAALGASIPEG